MDWAEFGHRILKEKAKIGQGIATALDEIEQVFPEESLWVMTSLAEGADRLATSFPGLRHSLHSASNRAACGWKISRRSDQRAACFNQEITTKEELELYHEPEKDTAKLVV